MARRARAAKSVEPHFHANTRDPTSVNARNRKHLRMSTKKHGFRIWGHVYPIYNVIASIFDPICVVYLNRGKQRSLAREHVLVRGFAYHDKTRLRALSRDNAPFFTWGAAL